MPKTHKKHKKTPFLQQFFRRKPLLASFLTLSVLFAATVTYQNATLDASTIKPISRTGGASSSSLKPEQAKRQTRLKLRVIRKEQKQLQKNEHRFNARYIRTATGVNLAKPGSFALPTITYEKARCGDKLVLADETCDDGNNQNGDGCSAGCQIEKGFFCNAAQPSYCWDSCGDGYISSREECDDSNTADGDGCNAFCNKEPGYACAGEPSSCTVIPFCGNAIVDQGETCDDGNVRSGDGCSATCKTE